MLRLFFFFQCSKDYSLTLSGRGSLFTDIKGKGTDIKREGLSLLCNIEHCFFPEIIYYI